MNIKLTVQNRIRSLDLTIELTERKCEEVTGSKENMNQENNMATKNIYSHWQKYKTTQI